MSAEPYLSRSGNDISIPRLVLCHWWTNGQGTQIEARDSRDREFLRSLAGTSLNDIPIIGNREFISELSAQGWNGNGRCDQPEPC